MTSSRLSVKEWIGIVLLVLSFVLYWSVLAVPWLDASTGRKIAVGTALAITGEVTFWLGVAIAGRDFMRRYRAWFSWAKLRELLRDSRDETPRDPPA